MRLASWLPAHAAQLPFAYLQLPPTYVSTRVVMLVDAPTKELLARSRLPPTIRLEEVIPALLFRQRLPVT
jgi:hypothetical protein